MKRPVYDKQAPICVFYIPDRLVQLRNEYLFNTDWLCDSLARCTWTVSRKLAPVNADKKTCSEYSLSVTGLHQHGTLIRKLESQDFHDIQWNSLNFEHERIQQRNGLWKGGQRIYKSTLKSSQTESAWVISRGISFKTSSVAGKEKVLKEIQTEWHLN